MSGKWTAGTWRVVGSSVEIPTGGPYNVTAAFCGTVENARLMGASRELYAALEPFARFGAILRHMGGNSPKSGEFYRIEAARGEASITVEDFTAAIAALSLARGEQ